MLGESPLEKTDLDLFEQARGASLSGPSSSTGFPVCPDLGKQTYTPMVVSCTFPDKVPSGLMHVAAL